MSGEKIRPCCFNVAISQCFHFLSESEGFHFLSDSFQVFFRFPFCEFLRVSISFLRVFTVFFGFHFLSESFPFLFSISCVGFSSFCLRVEGFLFFSDCL